tara:strand:+ start:27737 stop:28120 length:384 start_codon:yes stop_codon:yes gene_type:complete
MEELVKKEFLRRILIRESADLRKDQGIAIRKYVQFHTGQTLNTRKYSVQMNDKYLSGQIHIQERAHIRFLDIKKKSVRKSDGTIGRRRIRYIYNRHMFRAYLTIARRVMYGLTMEVADGIKKQLNQN